jgi:hypothetical protein
MEFVGKPLSKIGTSTPFSRTDLFWKKVVVSGLDDCWNWVAGKSYNGYGRFRFNGRTGRSHRYIYEITRGVLPVNSVVMHSCDNPACCNPAHLALGTCADNMKDMRKKGRERWAVGEGVGGAKLTAEQIISIRSDGRFQKNIAAELGVSQATISRVKRHNSWRHI